MANIIMGCDLNSTASDQQTLKKIGKILENAGHSVELLSVGPNFVQSAMQQSSTKGKIAIYLVNGADLQTYRDFHDGITQGYYHAKYAYFGLQGWITPSTCSCNGAKTAKLKRAHDDQSPVSYTAALVGMTTAEVCEKYKKAIAYACGSSAEELGNNLVKVIGGGSNSDGSGSSASTIKNAMKEVLYGWNGDVECYLRDDTIYINKIRDPTSAKLQLVEDVNVFMEGISITDIDPNTPNKLIVKWHNNKFIIKDDARIKRFGEVSKTITSSNKTEKDAVDFAYHEWNKLLKDSGRKLECKIDGGPEWRIGQWVRVYIPSFNLNGYMYLTKVSHDDNLDWKVNVTLEDWPPDLGTKPAEKAKTTEEATDSDSSSEDTKDSETETEEE
ncbi:hypothetical protein [uncultured Methanobrevibacter sp.]|uniref:XkdQ/YqbQ family protein n=1 Tax=uncultured Methanobrevibacter sp. TaxID=253161 RepID=UPI0025E0C30B|nr:hypothetical protein [uncultured Methanobrevibacter sp.]